MFKKAAQKYKLKKRKENRIYCVGKELSIYPEMWRMKSLFLDKCWQREEEKVWRSITLYHSVFGPCLLNLFFCKQFSLPLNLSISFFYFSSYLWALLSIQFICLLFQNEPFRIVKCDRRCDESIESELLKRTCTHKYIYNERRSLPLISCYEQLLMIFSSFNILFSHNICIFETL